MTFGVDVDEELDELNDRPPAAPVSGLHLRDSGTDLFRGMLVVLAALAIGAFILTQGADDSPGDETAGVELDDQTATESTLSSEAENPDADSGDPAAPAADSDAPASSGSTSETSVMEETTTTELSTTTTLELESTVRPPDEVQVVVLNATDRKGIAGQGTDLLAAAGFGTVPAANATSGIGSVIYYEDGYRGEALAVAEVFGGGLNGLVQPYDPADPPAAADDIADANVIVVLGVDDAIPVG